MALLLDVPCLCWGGGGKEEVRSSRTALTPSPSLAGVCPSQSQHRRHPQAALGKDVFGGDRQELCPQARCCWGSGSPLMLPPSVPSQVPAPTAEQPQQVTRSQRGPSAGPASRGNCAGWPGSHGISCHWPTWDSTDPVLTLPRSELEPQGQDSAVSGKLVAEADGRGSSAGDEEPEQLGLT